MFRYNSLQRRFDRWLRSNGSGNGYLVIKDINVAYIPKKQRDGMLTLLMVGKWTFQRLLTKI